MNELEIEKAKVKAKRISEGIGVVEGRIKEMDRRIKEMKEDLEIVNNLLLNFQIDRHRLELSKKKIKEANQNE